MSGQCPACQASQRDTLLCAVCSTEIADALRLVMPDGGAVRAAGLRSSALPWERQRQRWGGLEIELTVTLIRAGKATTRVGGKSAEIPLPYDSGASKAADHLRAVLAVWTVAVHDLRPDPWPVDTLADMAAWLLDRLDVIRGHEQAARAHADITGAASRALQAIDRTPAEYAPELTHEQLLADVDAYLTGREVRDLLADRRVTVSAARFSNWVRRGRLTAATTDRQGRPLYRVSDVEALALTGRDTRHADAVVTR